MVTGQSTPHHTPTSISSLAICGVINEIAIWRFRNYGPISGQENDGLETWRFGLKCPEDPKSPPENRRRTLDFWKRPTRGD
jgi:hypothetical protein